MRSRVFSLIHNVFERVQMKVLGLTLVMFFGTVAYGNEGVKKNTDLGKRKVVSHSQVTRCEGDNCRINSVTKFDKVLKKEGTSYGECVFSDNQGARFSQCDLSPKKKKPKAQVKTVVKTKVVNTIKKNRIQVHVGSGPAGLSEDSSNNRATITQERAFLIGGQYTRLLEDDLSVGVAAFTNKSITLSIGFDY